MSKWKEGFFMEFYEQENDFFSDIEFFTISDIKNNKNTPKYLIEGILKENTVSLVSSASKVGKTTFCTLLAHAVSTGSTFLGRNVHKSGVLYVSKDTDLWEFNERLNLMGLQENNNFNYCFPLNMIITPRSNKENYISLQDLVVEAKNKMDNLKLIVLDMFKDFRDIPAQQEYNNTYIREDIFTMRGICKIFEINIIFLQHTRKDTTNDPLADVMGGQDTTGSIDGTIFCLQKIENEIQPKIMLYLRGRVRNQDYKLLFNPEKLLITLDENQKEETNRYSDPLIGLIRNYVVKNKRFEGSLSELAAALKITQSSNEISYHLNKSQDVLNEENIYFEKLKRTRDKRPYVIELIEKDEEN